jgi:7-carboxy-7-deazaguanine synthase
LLKVNEIFYSIQGESSYAGLPCVFVRLTGCNLRCSYCDASYAYEEGKDLEIGEIIDRVKSYRCRLVEITGGEPLIQKDTPHLIYALLEKGLEVLLETNGSLDISLVDGRCTKIVDIKCPSSGEDKKNDLGNLKRLSVKDEIKFVIGSREDYLYAQNICL